MEKFWSGVKNITVATLAWVAINKWQMLTQSIYWVWIYHQDKHGDTVPAVTHGDINVRSNQGPSPHLAQVNMKRVWLTMSSVFRQWSLYTNLPAGKLYLPCPNELFWSKKRHLTVTAKSSERQQSSPFPLSPPGPSFPQFRWKYCILTQFIYRVWKGYSSVTINSLSIVDCG